MLPVAVLSAAVAAYEILWTKTNQAFPIRTSSAGGTSQTLVEANLSFAATQLSHWAQLIIALLQVTALYAFCWSGWSLVDCLSVDMYDTKLRRTPSPETTCSIVEYITISWFDPLLNEGYKRTLTPADLWDITPDEKVGPSVENFAPVENSKVHLLLKLIWSNRRTIAFQQCLVVLNATLYFGGPFFLNKILRVLEQKEPVYWAYIYTVGMLLAAQAKLITVGQLNQTGRKLAMRMRGVLITLVYKKSLRRVPVLSTGLLRGKEPKTQKKNKTPVAKETNDVAARMGK
ncbi:hypothetical protein DFJ73DRAFT_224767 [Zopfochytrium polystomum]|nr:hypothetical protein DFJ73DRAFT_224767 [Zopfochytrium polystomum]